jgi:O-antigen/teichoic acid export membrane protein
MVRTTLRLMTRPLVARLRSPFVVSIGTAAFLGLLGFVSSALAARLLQPVGRGELAAIQTVPTLLGILGMLGQADAVTYFAAREPQRAGSITSSSVLIAGLGWLALSILGVGVLPLVLRNQRREVVVAALLFLVFGLGLGSINVSSAVLRASNRFVSWNVFRAAPAVLWSGLVAFAYVRHDRSAPHLGVSFAWSLALMGVPIAVLILRRLPSPRRPMRSDWPVLLRYGLPSMATSVPQVLNLRLDQVLLTLVVPSEKLGYYVTAVGWSTSVSLLVSGFAHVVFPTVAREKVDADQRRVLARHTRRGALLVAGLVVFFMLLTPLVVPLVYGRAFKPAVPVSFILVGAAGLIGLNQVLAEGARGLGRPGDVLRAELAGLVVTVIALAAFIPPFGIFGGGIASAVGYSATTLVLTRRLGLARLPLSR